MLGGDHSEKRRKWADHDALFDWLLKIPERELWRLLIQDKNMTWTLLALRAGYIRLGMIRKY
jgi:hypothetical protein